jgi:5-methylcytosine-specific restriction protein A
LRRLREVVLYRDGHRCQRCGSPDTTTHRLHVHHVVARAEGGTDSLDNLVTLCALCHPQVERSAPADLGGLRKGGGALR